LIGAGANIPPKLMRVISIIQTYANLCNNNSNFHPTEDSDPDTRLRKPLPIQQSERRKIYIANEEKSEANSGFVF
jgi:hypothetical protein